MSRAQLEKRLRNWGEWLCYEARITPDQSRCTSLEAQFIPEADEVWEPSTLHSTPNVADAEEIERTLKRLFEENLIGMMERYCLAVRWGGYAAVFRVRRVGDDAMKKFADNCEIVLYEALRKSA